jgi:hypothetical protein
MFLIILEGKQEDLLKSTSITGTYIYNIKNKYRSAA